MKSSGERLSYLFSRYHDKTATEQEINEFFLELKNIPDDELTALLWEVWEKSPAPDPLFKPEESAAILNRILEEGRRNGHKIIAGSYRRKYAVIIRVATAAALVLVTSVVYFQNKPVHVPQQKITKSVVLNDALPGGNKATLTLANGKTIILDDAQNGILARQANVNVKKAKDGQLIYHVIGHPPSDQMPRLNTISTPRGGQYQVVLPDGSKVWLNAASSLKFPTLFKNKTREVELTGEAYFEVAKNAAMPFKVKSGSGEVEVLGTHFNVMAYADEAEMKTTLLEGAVKIKSGSGSEMLRPGEQAVLNESGLIKKIAHANVDEEVAWKNGLFQFDDTDIQTVMRQASRWYDLDISYEGTIPLQRFTGRISRNVRASGFLSMLEYMGLNFRIQGKSIVIRN